jgi:hypothetical protein
VLANDLNVTQDASCGSWIKPRLRGDFGAVTLAVPSGYAAYARICHPASDPQGNLFWPADRAWCVASEIDFDSTLIGGSIDLIRNILDAPGLDAWAVGPDDSLAYDADHVNEIPTHPLTRPKGGSA